MARQPLNEWRANVTRLKTELESAPDDLELANRYWAAIGGEHGYDARNGKRLIDTFRTCALKSDDGLGCLLSAMRRLSDECGEFPRAALFDPPLENRLRSIAHEATHVLHDDASWIIGFIDIEA